MRNYTVTSLNEELATLFGNHYPTIQVEGEVGQIQTPASGHTYLNLRDKESSLSAVIWRSDWNKMSYHPQAGDRVCCRGRLGVYGRQGRYQLYVNKVEPAGEGALARDIQARIARLAAEGLLDPQRKRPLPPVPKVVGVATSLTGAALQDFLKVSRVRFPATRILVSGCTVQGEYAAESVIRAMDRLIQDGRSEVIVVTRGGGSKEDLLPFFSETLARAIANCPVPVLSAVGHEIDTTISDMVADAVASTPSSAAMRVLPDGASMGQRVDELWLLLVRKLEQKVGASRQHIDGLSQRLRAPERRIHDGHKQCQALMARMEHQLRIGLTANSEYLHGLQNRLGVGAARQCRDGRIQVQQGQQRLMMEMRSALHHNQQRFRSAALPLEALSPLKVLGRGYGMVVGPEGKVVTSSGQVNLGDPLTIRLHKGSVFAQVTDVEKS